MNIIHFVIDKDIDMDSPSLPFGAPPILVEIKSQVQNYLENPQLLPIHDLEMVQQYWKHETNMKQLCQPEVAATPTTLLVERDINTGALAEIVEIITPHVGTNKTSMSLQRIPGIELNHIYSLSSTALTLVIILHFKDHQVNGFEVVQVMCHSGLVDWNGIHLKQCQICFRLMNYWKNCASERVF